MLTSISTVSQYKIQIDQAIMTNTSECVQNTVEDSCVVILLIIKLKCSKFDFLA